MIRKIGEEIFVLDTLNTSYVIEILPTGQPAHLYYGKKIRIEEPSDAEALRESCEFAPGNSTYYDDEHKNISLEAVKLEMSGQGKGDYDEPLVKLRFSDGSRTTDFVYIESEVKMGKAPLADLPSSYGEETEVATLALTLKDRTEDVYLKLYYYVYENRDVICRSSELINESQSEIYIESLMSTQLDLDAKDYKTSGYSMTAFTGAWAREMQKRTTELSFGKLSSGSAFGASSNHANPFVMIHETSATEGSGDVYGCNLIYSGNHRETLSLGAYGRVRFLSGINPDGFGWSLAPGDSFMSPEAVMAYSSKGFQRLSRIYHDFIRKHIVRGEWRDKKRPVLFNSWESCYFDFDEAKLLKLADRAAEAGLELFVMDDGWFGERNDDSSSLGDWTINRKKLPHGLEGLSNKIHAKGLLFGIWVEPEMVNVNSKLYREHPDWTLENPDRNHSEGRNQRVLNLALPAVQEHIIEAMSQVFTESKCDYVKWDYNRNYSDVYSTGFEPDSQIELGHRYMLGLYRVMKTLTERFPHILFEGCAAGGNRFDLGILSYFPQIWASDDTDPIMRLDIQEGYSYGYPVGTYTAHVGASPNHQTLRATDIFTRFAVASFEPLGYEFNIADMSEEGFKRMQRQIKYYKQWQQLAADGHFYRLENTDTHTSWMLVSRGGKRAAVMRVVKKTVPNRSKNMLWLKGLRPDVKYHVYTIPRRVNVKDFGDLVNTMAPIHIRQDSLIHNVVAKVVKMETPTVDMHVFGDTLMNAGLQLPPGYGGTGYNERTFLATDYSAEIYLLEADI